MMVLYLVIFFRVLHLIFSEKDKKEKVYIRTRYSQFSLYVIQSKATQSNKMGHQNRQIGPSTTQKGLFI